MPVSCFSSFPGCWADIWQVWPVKCTHRVFQLAVWDTENKESILCACGEIFIRLVVGCGVFCGAGYVAFLCSICFSLSLSFFFFLSLATQWDFSSPTRIKPQLSAMRAWSPNHWTARELPGVCLWDCSSCFLKIWWVNKYCFSTFIFCLNKYESACIVYI